MAAAGDFRVKFDERAARKAAVESQTFHLNVVRYGESFDVHRSLAEFKALRASLEQRFPKTPLPALPATRHAALAWASTPGEEEYVATRKGLQEFVDKILGHVDADGAAELHRGLHDVAESDMFGMFFMPEEVRKHLAEVPRAVMFLLQASPFESVTVGRGSTHEKTIKIRKGGQVAVWEFSVQSLDIGFKVEFDGAPVAEQLLVKANGSEPSEIVQGRFSAARAGKLVLCWDNSYSMMRAKSVSLRVEVVGAEMMIAADVAEVEGRRALFKRLAINAKEKGVVDGLRAGKEAPAGSPHSTRSAASPTAAAQSGSTGAGAGAGAGAAPAESQAPAGGEAAKVAQLQAQVAELQEQLASATVRCDEMSTELEDVKSERAAAQHVVLQLRSELDVVKQQHKATQKEHEELVAALPEIREHAWECGAATIGTWAYIALRGLNVAWKKQQEVAAKEMAELRARCETLNDENKAWRFSKRDMESRIEELEAQATEDQARVTEAEDNEKAAATELEVALAQLGDASVKVQALTTENEKLKKNVNAGGGKGKQMYLEAKLDANSLRATLAQVKAAFAKQSTHLKRLKAEKKLLVRELRRRTRAGSEDGTSVASEDESHAGSLAGDDAATAVGAVSVASGGSSVHGRTASPVDRAHRASTPTSAGLPPSHPVSAGAAIAAASVTRGSPPAPVGSVTVGGIASAPGAAALRGAAGVSASGLTPQSAPPDASGRGPSPGHPSPHARRPSSAVAAVEPHAQAGPSPFASHQFLCLEKGKPALLHSVRRPAHPRYTSFSNQLVYVSQPVSVQPQGAAGPSTFGITPRGFDARRSPAAAPSAGRGAAPPAKSSGGGFFQKFADKVKDFTAELTSTEVLTSCDSCRVPAIKGTRWRCATCPNFDMCDRCYQRGSHGHEPPLQPQQQQPLAPRPGTASWAQQQQAGPGSGGAGGQRWGGPGPAAPPIVPGAGGVPPAPRGGYTAAAASFSRADAGGVGAGGGNGGWPSAAATSGRWGSSGGAPAPQGFGGGRGPGGGPSGAQPWPSTGGGHGVVDISGGGDSDGEGSVDTRSNNAVMDLLQLGDGHHGGSGSGGTSHDPEAV